MTKVRQARLDYQQKIGRPVSITEVATAIGISRAALSNIERERNEASLKVLAGLCGFYKVGVGDLLEYIEEADELK
jgi:DNA-binding Xre family transcriptional regulator